MFKQLVLCLFLLLISGCNLFADQDIPFYALALDQIENNSLWTRIGISENIIYSNGNVTVNETLFFANGGSINDNLTCTFINSPAGGDQLQVCDGNSIHFINDNVETYIVNRTLAFFQVDTNVNATMTANYFVGDGAGITNLSELWESDGAGNIYYDTGNVNVNNTLTAGGQTMLGGIGVTLYTDTKGDTHVIQADGTTIDRLRAGVILNEVDMTFFSNTSGIYLNVSSTDGTTIKVNIGGRQKNTGTPEYLILLNNGTEATPVLNIVYLFNVTNPTIGITTDEDSIDNVDHVLFARALIGNFTGTTYNLYASYKGDDLVQDFLHNLNDRLYFEGLLYLNGFEPTVSANSLNISTGTYFNSVFKHSSPNNLTLAGGAFYVNSTGQYVSFTSLSEITRYSDTGNLIGNSKYYNIVWGIVVSNGVVRLIALIQEEPSTEYNSVSIALQDSELKLVSRPEIPTLRYAFIPIARTITQIGTYQFEIIAGVDRFRDLRDP